MTPTELDQATKAVVRAVKNAGTIVQDAWNRPRRIDKKGPIDLVTETDKAVEDRLRALLAKDFPNLDFFGEESAQGLTPPNAAFIVDPVDGTTNFIHQIPFVGISVGLWMDNNVQLGVVYNPILDECFDAHVGGGARMNNNPIRVSSRAPLLETLVATGFPYIHGPELNQTANRLAKVLDTTRGVRRLGAASLDLAYVAQGRFDAFYESNLKPWDVAAGIRLVLEAGGTVSTYDANTPHTLNSPSILAANPHIHNPLSTLLLSA